MVNNNFPLLKLRMHVLKHEGYYNLLRSVSHLVRSVLCDKSITALPFLPPRGQAQHFVSICRMSTQHAMLQCYCSTKTRSIGIGYVSPSVFPRCKSWLMPCQCQGLGFVKSRAYVWLSLATNRPRVHTYTKELVVVATEQEVLPAHTIGLLFLIAFHCVRLLS